MEKWLLGAVAAAVAAYDRCAEELFLFEGLREEKLLVALKCIWAAEQRTAMAAAIEAKDNGLVELLRNGSRDRFPSFLDKEERPVELYGEED